MARNLTAQEHAEEAARLLEESRSKGIASPARSIIVAEAQVHATLALVGYAAPATLKLPEPVLASDEPSAPSTAPLIAAEDTTDDTPSKPAPKRRTRKAAASDEEAAK